MKTEPNDIINAFEETDGSGSHYHTHMGLSKREYFAAMAMQGYVGAEYTGQRGMPFEDMAKWSVQMADALIKELNLTKP
jgi:hypothetical protein